MLINYDFFQTLLLILAYLLIYNVTSLLLFFTVVQIAKSDVKTLFSFAHLNVLNIYTKTLSLVVMSLAGVPPLLGFFSKVFLFILVSHLKLFSLFLPLFTLLFAVLYFYIQNLRFLNSTSRSLDAPVLGLAFRPTTLYFLCSLPLIFLQIFGFCFIDDLLLFSSWVIL